MTAKKTSKDDLLKTYGSMNCYDKVTKAINVLSSIHTQENEHTSNTNEYLETVYDLNCQYLENNYQEGILPLTYKTDGFVDCIEFNGEILYNSEWGEREFIDSLNGYEPLKPFILKLLKMYVQRSVDTLNAISYDAVDLKAHPSVSDAVRRFSTKEDLLISLYALSGATPLSVRLTEGYYVDGSERIVLFYSTEIIASFQLDDPSNYDMIYDCLARHIESFNERDDFILSRHMTGIECVEYFNHFYRSSPYRVFIEHVENRDEYTFRLYKDGVSINSITIPYIRESSRNCIDSSVMQLLIDFCEMG